MKKVIVIATLFAAVLSNNVNAQRSGARVATTDLNGDGNSERLSVNHTKIEGTNTVPLSNGRGTLKFVSRGNKITDVMFTDASGKSTRLIPIPSGTAGAPKTECKYPIPDACFGTADKSIGLCMCRSTNLSAAPSSDPTAILIGILLPAVQKVREAANK